MSSTTAPPTQPPKVYRAMKRNPADNLPVVGATSSSELGARSGVDISVDAAGNVVRDGTGMSVSAAWRNLAQYQTDLENTRAAWQIDET